MNLPVENWTTVASNFGVRNNSKIKYVWNKFYTWCHRHFPVETILKVDNENEALMQMFKFVDKMMWSGDPQNADTRTYKG